jgi:hypothetical protein
MFMLRLFGDTSLLIKIEDQSRAHTKFYQITTLQNTLMYAL